MSQPAGARPTGAAEYGVAYSRMPRVGQIEPLHGLNSESGRTVCGEAVAMSWSPEDSADTEIDCHRCLAALARMGHVG